MTAVSSQRALKRDEGEQAVNKARLRRDDPRLTIGVILRKRTLHPTPTKAFSVFNKTNSDSSSRARGSSSFVWLSLPALVMSLDMMLCHLDETLLY